jgi:hypothetical protein
MNTFSKYLLLISKYSIIIILFAFENSNAEKAFLKTYIWRLSFYCKERNTFLLLRTVC